MAAQQELGSATAPQGASTRQTDPPSGSVYGRPFALCQCGCGYVSSGSNSLPFRPHHTTPASRFPCGAAKIPGPAALPPWWLELALLDARRQYATGYGDPTTYIPGTGWVHHLVEALHGQPTGSASGQSSRVHLGCVVAVAPMVGPCAPFTDARAARLSGQLTKSRADGSLGMQRQGKEGWILRPRHRRTHGLQATTKFGRHFPSAKHAGLQHINWRYDGVRRQADRVRAKRGGPGGRPHSGGAQQGPPHGA